MRLGVLFLVALGACSSGPPAEEGVNVFSADTSTAYIMVDVVGTLQVGLRSDGIGMTRDRKLVLSTPATLVFKKGDGEITVHSVDSTQRIVLESMSAPPDSTGNQGTTGLVVTAMRAAGERQPRFRVDRP